MFLSKAIYSSNIANDLTMQLLSSKVTFIFHVIACHAAAEWLNA